MKLKNNIALAAAFAGIGIAGAYWMGRSAAPQPEAIEIIRQAEEKAETAMAVAEETEAIAIEARPRVRAAATKAAEATETRVESGFSLGDLPEPVALEMAALRELVKAQAAQLELEIQRADSWKEAALAQKDLADTLKGQQAAMLKAERRRGLKWGFVGGAGIALLLVVLL